MRAEESRTGDVGESQRGALLERWPERKAIQVKWLEALVSLFSFRRVSRNRVSAQTTDGTDSAVPQLEIEGRVVLDSGAFRGFSRLA